MDITRSTLGRFSDNEASNRDIPSFIEPRPPLILNPFMRPKPVMKTNLLEQFEEEDSELEDLEFVQVYLRLKPCDTPSNLYEVQSDKSLITTLDVATVGHGRRTQHNVSKMYTFSHIFGAESTQKEIFDLVVKDNLRKLADGHSYTLLTYGASGSGKTYTLMGTVSEPGLIPRSLEYVFKVVDTAQQPLYKPSDKGADMLNHAEQDYEMQLVTKLRQVSTSLRRKYRRMSAKLSGDFSASSVDLSTRTRCYVWVSFVEIYNEAVYDLLVNCDRRAASKLRIREDPSGHVYVKGATQAFVRSGAEAYDVLVAGKLNLQVAATGVNARSSRSHCIFTITLLAHTDEGVRVSSVRLCDLAGAERAARARVAGARLAESKAINGSLHVLERCLHALRRKRKQAEVVPYRESKLTRLLGAGLSGARGHAVSMVVTVNPEPRLAHETRHVLQLAAVARDIQVNNTIAESSLEYSQDSTLLSGADASRLKADNDQLRADNERLQFELARAQAHYKELLRSSEERRARAAETMKEIAAEAKDLTREFYEAEIEAMQQKHRAEMDDLTEEYENKLLAANRLIETQKKKIAQLTTENAILEENRNVVQLAHARALQEEEHLRAVLEEMDSDKLSDDNASTKISDEDLTNNISYNASNTSNVVNESTKDVLLEDSEPSDDELNESLEPSLRKDLNASTTSESDSDDSVIETTPKYKPNENTNTVRKVVNKSIAELSESMDVDYNAKESIDNTSLARAPIDNTSLARESVERKSIESVEASYKESISPKVDVSKTSIRDSSSLFMESHLEEKAEARVSRGTYVVFNENWNADCESTHIEDNLESSEKPSENMDVTKNIDSQRESIDTERGNIDEKKDDIDNKSIVHDIECNSQEIQTTNRQSENPEIITTEEINKTEQDLSKMNLKDDSVINEIETKSECLKKEISINKDIEDFIKNEINVNEKDSAKNAIPTSETKVDSIKIKTSIKEELKTEAPTNEEPKFKENLNETKDIKNNTADEFEDLFKNCSNRATEFELLVKEKSPKIEEKSPKKEEKKVRYNLRDNTDEQKPETKPRRTLRLRKRKGQEDDVTKQTEKVMKDIENLQMEFSDVTLGLPVVEKAVKDIPSPTKDENCPPGETMSCPAKSITRSRRKLFTPRAEPLEESPANTGDSTERIRVPRPSYHRGRARRKL